MQHDRARSHTANVTSSHRTHLGYAPIHVLTPPRLENLAQLRQAFIAEWDDIPHRCIAEKNLSMRQRCQSLIYVHGGYTRY